MFKLICQKLHHVPSHNRFFNQTHLFSSSLTSIQTSPNQHSFTINFLTNSCGFSLKDAISASKYVRFETPDKPDSVLAFFKNHGFTRTQISNIIRKYPRVLLCDTQKNLLPKLEFLKSKGISSTDFTRIVSSSPFILKRSLENIIIPFFNFFSNFLQSQEKAMSAIERCSRNFSIDRQSHVIPNCETLLGACVPNANIMICLVRQPKVFMTSGVWFGEIVEDVVKMGFKPSEMRFLKAVEALTAMTKSTWKKKVDVYKKWGWTEDEIVVAVKNHPCCMAASEDKINRVMDFLVNQMGWESSLVVRRPIFFSHSLEKRIIPRSAVYQALVSKGLIKASNIRLMRLLNLNEKTFVKRVLSYHEEEGPELLKLYKEKSDLVR